jgi:hypothetical protein
MQLKAKTWQRGSGTPLRYWAALAVIVALCIAFAGKSAALPGDASNVRQTKHNLSKDAPNSTTKADSEDQVCVFCHTPHAATPGQPALWNREVHTSGYTRYNSESLDASRSTDTYKDQPAGSSVLCLSCHDGQVALGSVNVIEGWVGAEMSVGGSVSNTMPVRSGLSTGFTPNLGTDLSNDHPISVTYNDAVAQRDGELARLTTEAPKQRHTTQNTLIGIRDARNNYKPTLPLLDTGTVAGAEGQIQCSTCHDPHLYDASDANRKFLRLRRLQSDTAPTATFDEEEDIICLACHTKLGTSWAYSAHADSGVADETYGTATTTTLRGFASTTKVANASCLNCHDTHTVTGARRLLREGVTGSGSPKLGGAGTSAIEETCYQCHSASKIIGGTTNTCTDAMALASCSTATTNIIPDIKSDFERSVRMPITGTEVHDIGGNFDDTGYVNCTTNDNKCGADMIESRARMGHNNLNNRHVECTDCHNPHRVRRNSVFYGTPGDANSTKRTHDVGGASGNVASGVLRGTWGVEPGYGTITASTTWPSVPSGFDVKRGDPSGSDTGKSNTYLTREYQLCFKCHSNYAVNGAYPTLGGTGKTPSGTNSVSNYTNIAAEFGVKAVDGTTKPALNGTHQCEYGYPATDTCAPIGGSWGSTAVDSNGTSADTTDAIGNADTVNHRSWHPVHYPTGRDALERANGSTNGDTNFRVPFKASLGLQTMYCSDCHGNSGGVEAATTATKNSWTIDSGPNLRRTQGPHGSNYNFLLKGLWNPTSSNAVIDPTTPSNPDLCGNCHVASVSRTESGFGSPETSGHSSSEHGKRCTICHIALPHGWKNKAFLVNLNCVGPEGGSSVNPATSTQYNCQADVVGNQGTLTYGPYYVEARLRVKTWQRSRNWSETSCGPANGTTGKDWMTNVC